MTTAKFDIAEVFAFEAKQMIASHGRADAIRIANEWVANATPGSISHKFHSAVARAIANTPEEAS